MPSDPTGAAPHASYSVESPAQRTVEAVAKAIDAAVRSGGARRAGITPDLIIAAAVELSRDGGLESWTQRDLARRLDIAPSVLYHHVGGRDAVLRGVTEQVVSRFPVPDPDLDWPDWFRELLLPARQILLRFPGTAKWLLMHGPAFPAVTRIFDAGIASLHRGGVDQPAFVYAAIVNTAMLTISMRDDRLQLEDDGPRGHDRMLRDFEPLRHASVGIAAVIDELITPLLTAPGDGLLDTHEKYYRYVLDLTIAGVAAGIAPAD